MWTVEVNVLGRRFTHRAGDRFDVALLTPRLATRWLQSRQVDSKQRPPRAAA